MAKTKERKYFIDNLKGILIFLVVFGHFLESYLGDNNVIKYIYIIIYTFHMPLFALCSGYLASAKISYKKILKYFLLFAVLQILSAVIKTILNGSFDIFYIITPYWILWYLLSFVFWLLALKALKKVRLMTVVFSFLIAILIGYIPQIGTVLSLSRTITLFPFFILGYYIKQHPINYVKVKKVLSYIIPVLAITALIFLVFYIDKIQTSDLYFKNAYTENFGLISRLVLYLLAFIFSIQTALLTPVNQNKLLSAFGRQSLSIYLFHAAIILPLTLIPIAFNNYLILAIGIVLSVVTCLILSTKFFNINKILK